MTKKVIIVMAEASSKVKMAQDMKVNGNKTRGTVMARWYGRMDDATMAIGLTTSRMDRAY